MQDSYLRKIMVGKKKDMFQTTYNIYKMCLISLYYYDYLLVHMSHIFMWQKEICTGMSEHGMVAAFNGLEFLSTSEL